MTTSEKAKDDSLKYYKRLTVEMLNEVLLKLEEEKNAALKSTKKTTKKSQKEEVAGIRTAEEVINYINNRFDKDCRTLETAMKHADKAGLIFPDYGKQ